MIYLLIRDYCGRNGITIPKQVPLFEDGEQPPKRAE